MQVRSYDTKDRQAIIDLFLLNTPAYFDPKEQQDLEHYLDKEIEGYYVATDNDSIAGCGGYNLKDGAGYLSWYIVHPAYHGKGVGRSLVQNSLDMLKNKHGLSRVTVRTSQLTWEFYAKFGFRLIDTAKDYWGKGLDLYVMVLE